MTQQRIFAEVQDGRRLAIRNWRHRRRQDDVMIAVPLSSSQKCLYHRGKGAGASDEEIFDQIFPNPEPSPPALSIPLERLTKSQIIYILTERLGQSLATIARLSRSDLCILLRALGQHRRGLRVKL